MYIAINGFGRMGRLIHTAAEHGGLTVTAVIDPVSDDPRVSAREITRETLNGAEVVIDFSLPAAALDTMRACAACGVSIVVGTTGWYDQMDQARSIIEDAQVGCIWSGNFSLGVNLLFALVRQAAGIMTQFPEYDCMVHEYHHRNKADSPSGTASMIGSLLIDGLDHKDRMVTEALDHPIGSDELHVSSTRGGSIPGTHTITFDSDVDTIEITHRARNREGFALGAVKAAGWIGKRRGFFTIDDMMADMLGGR
ncbi:MAG: 4-hydroxy-tetrahydrodipicolinate reductase [Spirochaetia bacterium]|nr:4-hydroxy-tetrahydrodipicolinate reductase [Spirochaetia bacterium]